MNIKSVIIFITLLGVVSASPVKVGPSTGHHEDHEAHHEPHHEGHHEPHHEGHHEPHREGHHEPHHEGHHEPHHEGHREPHRGPHHEGHREPHHEGHREPHHEGHREPHHGGPHRHGEHEHEGPHHEGLRHPHGGAHRNPLSFMSSELLFEELFNRGLLGGHRGNQGPKRGPAGKRNKHHPRPEPRGRRTGLSGAGVGVGGAVSQDSSKDILAGTGSASHDSGHGSIESHRGSAHGKEFDFEEGGHSDVHNEEEALHKHQLLGTDKTVIKDKTFGVNDVDGFRKSNGASTSKHQSSGGSEHGSQNEDSRLEGSASSSNDENSFLEGASENHQKGALGAGAGIGHIEA